jgi:hypothetical protein
MAENSSDLLVPLRCPRCGSSQVYAGEAGLTCLKCRLRFSPRAGSVLRAPTRTRKVLWAIGVFLISAIVVSFW